MDCSRRSSRDHREDGYATTAATVVCLSLAMMAAATMAFSLTELHRARTDLARTQAEASLDGAHAAAALAVAENPGTARLQWSLTTQDATFQILAEPEEQKMSLARAADLDDQSLAKLGASAPKAVKVALSQLATRNDATVEGLRNADPAPRWRQCASTFISRGGRGQTLSLPPAIPPQSGPSVGHAGEIWRLRVSLGGFADDRIVRFSGNPHSPAATVERWFYRSRDPTDCAGLTSEGRP